MAHLNQFQTYSQKENTVTNNMLLMLSRLYQISPNLYNDYIAAITEDSEAYKVIPSFKQQVNNRGNGIIDGFINIPASKIIIETKLHSLESTPKLVKYAQSFDNQEHKILLHLSSKKCSSKQEEDIKKALNEEVKNRKLGTQIFFYSKTFEVFVLQLDLLSKEYPHENNLRLLSDDFRNYCETSGLINNDKHTLRAMACRQSFDLNKKHQLYFDGADRGYRNFTYLGIYAWKSVRFIGKIDNTIKAELDSNGKLHIIESTSKPNQEQQDRIKGVIKDAADTLGWRLDKGFRFFLLKEFTETDFNKTNPGGIFRVRYFDLKKELSTVPEKTEKIAEALSHKSWE